MYAQKLSALGSFIMMNRAVIKVVYTLYSSFWNEVFFPDESALLFFFGIATSSARSCFIIWVCASTIWPKDSI